LASEARKYQPVQVHNGPLIGAIVLSGAVVAAVLAWGRRWVFLGSWLAAVAGSAVLNYVLKGLFARPRPHFAHLLQVETSYSFPSGHAMESFVVYGMLAYFAVLALRS
jgi:membrane-associated phospholipid phosphatase